jgi:decaprenylphospho-beta-D-ribofuranose 2-oxidase
MRADRLAVPTETLEGYGMRQRARSRVARPTTVAEIAAVFAAARAEGVSVGLRGGGNSYGDAALNGEAITLDTSLMTRILAWDAQSGVITCEPGVTIAQLWRATLADGWWPPVVPGTMAVTLGGAAAANIHGKNNWRDGSFGEHILRFDLLLPSGETASCAPDERPDLFYAAIGGYGLLGCFTAIMLQLRRIYSGLVDVRQTAHPSLGALLAALDEGAERATHAVSWVDTGARGAARGRGLLKTMRELAPGEDPNPQQSLDPAFQPPSERLLGVLPTAWVPTLGRPLATPTGIALANWGQWLRGNLPWASRPHRERYAPANFLLNFIPDFKRIYRPGGLIQQQSFVQREQAPTVFRALLARSQLAGLQPALAVLKRHRPSPFLLNYLPDGYSLALDYAVPAGREAATLKLLAELNALVAASGGTFFLAKDSTLTPEDYLVASDPAALARFAQLKRQYDPDEVLQTNLYRRVLRPALEQVALGIPG